jgi:hypothetical protein
MLLILYIVQVICNQTLPPGTPTQLEQILLVFCIYLEYIYIQINTWAFPYWPCNHLETPIWVEG